MSVRVDTLRTYCRDLRAMAEVMRFKGDSDVGRSALEGTKAGAFLPPCEQGVGEEDEMAGGFDDEWALRVGRRILAGEGVDTEADKPSPEDRGRIDTKTGEFVLLGGSAYPRPWTQAKPTGTWGIDHAIPDPGNGFRYQFTPWFESTPKQPPVAEAVTDTDVEITVTPAQYEELITLRAQKEQQAELAMLRVRRQALEDDLEEAYDKLDAEKAQAETLRQSLETQRAYTRTAEAHRDSWMDQYKMVETRARRAENQIDSARAFTDKWRRAALLNAGVALGTFTAAVWGQQILAWIYS